MRDYLGVKYHAARFAAFVYHDLVTDDVEVAAALPESFHNNEGKGGVGSVEDISGALKLLNLFCGFNDSGVALVDSRSRQRRSLCGYGGAAGKGGDDDSAAVADIGGINMLKTAGRLNRGVDMRSRFVAEGKAADKRFRFVESAVWLSRLYTCRRRQPEIFGRQAVEAVFEL